MLKSVARALAEEFEDGSVFRIGGDEFLVFTDMAEEAAAGLAAEVKGKVEGAGIPCLRGNRVRRQGGFASGHCEDGRAEDV